MSTSDLPSFPVRSFDGAYTKSFPSTGQLELEGTFRRGRRHGTWKGWWPNGQLMWEVGWDNGLRQGPMHAFHENGTRHYVGEYLDDQQHGVWEFWYDDGAFQQRYYYEQTARPATTSGMPRTARRSRAAGSRTTTSTASGRGGTNRSTKRSRPATTRGRSTG